MQFLYRGGTVLLSGIEDGMMPIFVDDALRLTIIRPDGTVRDFYYDFSWDCQYHLVYVGPIDLTDYLLPGNNVIHAEILDQCISAWGTKGLWLVEFK
jgi:hypothetical protein